MLLTLFLSLMIYAHVMLSLLDIYFKLLFFNIQCYVLTCLTTFWFILESKAPKFQWLYISLISFIYLFIYLFMAALGLYCCVWAFSSSSKRGLLFVACIGFSLRWFLVLRSTGSMCAGSVVVAHGLCCSAACGISPDQSLNPCPLYWQADS